MAGMLGHLILFAVSAFGAVVQFDYLASDTGKAELRGKCQPAGDKLSCELTEVWAVPLSSDEEDQELRRIFFRYQTEKEKERAKNFKLKVPRDMEDVPREAMRDFWIRTFKEDYKDNPDDLAALKTEECRRDPRDFYQFRAAYNETFDAFVDAAKAVQKKLCEAKDAAAFAKARTDRWALVRSTCELRYGHYILGFQEKEGKWRHEGETKGAHPHPHCFPRMRTVMDCPEAKRCRVERVYEADKEEWRFRFGADKCPGDPSPASIAFSASLPRSRAKECKFLLDRERAAQCCAFGQ
jgi:hypothetical protein